MTLVDDFLVIIICFRDTNTQIMYHVEDLGSTEWSLTFSWFHIRAGGFDQENVISSGEPPPERLKPLGDSRDTVPQCILQSAVRHIP